MVMDYPRVWLGGTIMMVSTQARRRLIVALDVDSEARARQLIEELAPYVGMFKVGLELTSAIGVPQAIALVKEAGAEAFLDHKFHDIPNTVAKAVASSAKHGARAMTLHIGCGYKALMDAGEETKRLVAPPYPLLFGVTVLTSLTHQDLSEQGVTPPPLHPAVDDLEAQQQAIVTHQVLRLARLAHLAGLDGLIASPQELIALRQEAILRDMEIWTPGIRPAWVPSKDDQARTLTPYEAIKAGANALIIGRPITSPPKGISSVEAAMRILEEIGRALPSTPPMSDPPLTAA